MAFCCNSIQHTTAGVTAAGSAFIGIRAGPGGARVAGFLGRGGLARVVAIGACLSCVAVKASAANLVAHWRMNEIAAPYADSSGRGATLVQDPATTQSGGSPGVQGSAAVLQWQAVPGVSTRLYTTHPAVQTDSFGFSLWILPTWFNAWDNLVVKEMPQDSTRPTWARMAWQLHLLGDNGAGAAQLELVVRGDDNTQGDFFGAVASSAALPLHSAAMDWIHIAAGYDHRSGRLTLSVNGVLSSAFNSRPGAHNSGGGALDIGTARNGNDFQFFAGGTCVDDFQLYDGPLEPSDVAKLIASPGITANPFIITSVIPNGTEGASCIFNSEIGQQYAVEASTNLQNFATVTNVTAVSGTTEVQLSKPLLDAVFGLTQRNQLLVKVRAVGPPSGFEECQ